MSSHSDGDDNGKPQLPSPIQRILVIHLNLYERCMKNGESLGEGASSEELSEQILYYHRDLPITSAAASGNDNVNPPNPEISMKEAVQFLGLCSALYSLPSSLAPSMNAVSTATSVSNTGDDKTKEIHFEESTLIFIPLEASADLLTIVQVARTSKGECVSNTGSGNPLAIRASIERSHQLFCMLNGGGILHRLNGDPCPYEGMDRLYHLLKDLRKAKEEQHRIDNRDEKYGKMTSRIKTIVDDVRNLRKRLTIQSIRNQLDVHYDEYLSEFSLVASRNGGAGRCLVEVLPVPIAQDSGGHTVQLPPSFLSSNTMQSMKEGLHQSLYKHPPNKDDSPGVLAMFTFHEGQPLHCVSSTQSSIVVSSASANLLMAYMASYRSKMSNMAGCRHSIPLTTKSSGSLSAAQSGIRHLTRSIGSMAAPLTKDKILTDQSNLPPNEDLQQRGQFLSTPPNFMLSASQHIHSIGFGDDLRSIWAPRVHLPTTSSASQESSSTSVHMVLFQFLQFSFLVLLSFQSPTDVSLDNSRLLLMKLEEEISEAVLMALNDDGSNAAASNKRVMEWTNGPGQAIILLERKKHKMVLLPDPVTKSTRHDTRFRKSDKKFSSRRYLGFGPRKKKDTFNKYQSNDILATEWSALGLDCRHSLASRFPLDVCLAFDDMINEMSRKLECDPDSPLEICTCISYGWVYAYGKGDKEIYVFFDNSIYVTVADVQSAASRIRETFAAT
ncbi:hypothetical protein IV203_005856 [Nitzschia inconspicua]|uniref:Uncharacterized protein n=1 Tax=Nitzschia inconspicua TaxID=303405 RepID=A0A9K3KN43_9STRA|nr:hypothetical protein IV203_005856 [Nitzschia inconspicua]